MTKRVSGWFTATGSAAISENDVSDDMQMSEKKYQKIKKSVKKRWVKALRSGKYKQGVYALCAYDEDDALRYCCLGVLVEEEVGGHWILHQDFGTYSLDGYSDVFPDEAAKEIGLSDAAHDKLTQLNDISGKSFEEIADWIEENL